MELFDRGISRLVRMPRDLKRLLNVLRYSYPPVRDEVYFADFVAITAVRLSAPDLYDFLALNKDAMTHVVSGAGPDDPQVMQNRQRFDALIETAPAEERPFIHHVLRRIFPVWNQAYGAALGGTEEYEWLRQRRITAADAFDTYFRLSVLQSSVSAAEIRELLGMLADERTVGDHLARLATQIDPDGRRRVDKVLQMLRAYVPEIPDPHIGALVRVLFERGDELCELEDWGSYGPFCDDLIVALAMDLLRRLPPPHVRAELAYHVFRDGAGIGTIAAFYAKASNIRSPDAVFDEAAVERLEQELRRRVPDAVARAQSPLYPLLAASRRLKLDYPSQYVQGTIAIGGPAACDLLLRFFHGAGAVDGARMQERIRTAHDWLRPSLPGLSALFSWRVILAESPDWLDEPRRRGLERLLEADALSASPRS